MPAADTIDVAIPPTPVPTVPVSVLLPMLKSDTLRLVVGSGPWSDRFRDTVTAPPEPSRTNCPPAVDTAEPLSVLAVTAIVLVPAPNAPPLVITSGPFAIVVVPVNVLAGFASRRLPKPVFIRLSTPPLLPSPSGPVTTADPAPLRLSVCDWPVAAEPCTGPATVSRVSPSVAQVCDAAIEVVTSPAVPVPIVTGPAEAVDVMPPLPSVSTCVPAGELNVVSPEFVNTRPSIAVAELIRTVVEPVTVDWLNQATSPLVGVAVGLVPPDEGSFDQLGRVAQVPVVVLQYHVAAEAVDEHAKNRSTAMTHFSVSSKAVKPTRPTGRVPAHRLPHFEFMMNPRPHTIQTHQTNNSIS